MPKKSKEPLVRLYTDAHTNYDGFSTRTVKTIGVSTSHAKNPVREITLEKRDFDWQTGRYDSGSNRWCLAEPYPDIVCRVTLEVFTKFGDWILTDTPTLA